jgi:hypothetical protein
MNLKALVFLLAIVPAFTWGHGFKYSCDQRIVNLHSDLKLFAPDLEVSRFQESNFIFEHGKVYYCLESHNRVKGSEHEGYPKCGTSSDMFPSFTSAEVLSHEHLGLPRAIKFVRYIRECGSLYVAY